MSYKLDSTGLGLIFKKVKDNFFSKSEGSDLTTKVTNLENSIGEMGGGDMLKSTYDTNNDGKVDEAAHAATADSATNAEKLGGQAPSYYATAASVETAKQEAISTVLGEAVPADFDTLKEVATWIQNDTTGSTELINRVSTIENNYVKETELTALTQEEIDAAWDQE